MVFVWESRGKEVAVSGKWNRRSILKGFLAGGAVSVGLPWLESLNGSGSTAWAAGESGFPVRFGLFMWGNGALPEKWVPEMMGAPLSRNTALVLVLLATACVLPACVALGGAAPAPSLAPARLGFFELQASKYQSRVAERSSQDRCLVAWGKTQAPPPPPTALDKVKGALAGTVGFFQAAVAGGFAATVMFPVDMAKTRMQACAQTEASVAAAQRTYTGTFQTIGKVFTAEGPLSLFRGLTPVLIGSAPEMAVQITAYEMTREALVKNGQDPKDFKVQLKRIVQFT